MESRRSRGLARFFRQVQALFLKNLSFQRRNARTNAAITAFPALLCVLVFCIQQVVDSELARPPFQCGCRGTQCGVQYSTPIQAVSCAVLTPARWPALVQVPNAEVRARTHLHSGPCNASENCPVTVLLTGQNRQLAEGLGRLLFPPIPVEYLLTPGGGSNSSDYLEELSRVVAVSCLINHYSSSAFYAKACFVPQETLYVLQPQCQLFSSRNISENFDGIQLESVMFTINLSYLYVISMASTAYLNLFGGQNVEMRLEYLKEMPTAAVPMRLNLTTLLDALFFTWTVELLLPVILTYLVYEKEQRLRLMMKMHGLKDAPYWLISYAYFLSLSTVYMIFFMISGSIIGLWLVAMELIPGFSLYRGIYELSEYAAAGRNMGKPGMRWADLNNPVNGMKDVMILMSIEWIILLLVAFLMDHRPAWRPLFVFGFLSTRHSSPSEKPNKMKTGSRRVHVDMTKPDVFLERKVVKQLLKHMDMRNMIICHNLKKVYPGKNGNPDKHAVRGLSLALRKGQCFGMLGPNGAGKTSFINMMIGLLKPTYGTAYIHGMDLRTDMNEIYANIGLTLGDSDWNRASNVLWTTEESHRCCSNTAHSMEEAEELCDRIGIFIDGNFHCIGTPKELKARYGGTRTLTIMTSPEHEEEVEQLVSQVSPGYTRIYSVSGTQKFALPRKEVGLGQVFGAVEVARHAFPVLGWGVADTTLEEVFIRVAKEARAFDVLS
ncbi:hypothetical protein HU200_033231 [Digitaria exilis]|uniref:ABC transporter domain-containing protein n=1 Tax=Digitaria exilis TaxID=1010633 RepID=A0A835BMP3_9POAL|nr:hypothetical protein HU200_033231 [Digitaria exilis]